MASVAKKLGGQVRSLSIRPDRIDFRDREYQPPVLSLPPQYPAENKMDNALKEFSDNDLVLDQGTEGACAGYGLAALIHFVFWRNFQSDLDNGQTPDKPGQVSTRMLYNNARLYDEWDGEDYSGSSCRGAMKGWHKHGVCARELFPNPEGDRSPPKTGWDTDAASRPLGAYYRVNARSIADMQAAIYHTGAIYASAVVHGGWEVGSNLKKLDSALIHQDDRDPTGGHAFAIVGYTPLGFVIQNSWGPKWGFKGFAILPYEDWAQNGFDAWVAALGAPVQPVHGSAVSAKTTEDLMTRATQAAPGDEAITNTAQMDACYINGTPWATHHCQRHMIVCGDDGQPLRRLPETHDLDHNLDTVFEHVETTIKQYESEHLAVIFLSGLHEESAALKYVSRMGPYFSANKIHPIFIQPYNGLLDNLGQIKPDTTAQFKARLDRLKRKGASQRVIKTENEKRDRTFELDSRRFLGRPVWSQTRLSAKEAARGNGVIRRLTGFVRNFLKNHPDMGIHIVAHSAGAQWAGHFLTDLKQARTTRGSGAEVIDSLTLWAPACNMDFANQHFGEALTNGILNPGGLHIDIMSERRESEDWVIRPDIYGKSMLYLISRALESVHKTPLLGMEWVWMKSETGRGKSKEAPWKTLDIFSADAARNIEEWHARLDKLDLEPLHIDGKAEVSTGETTIRLSHDSYLSNIRTLKKLLTRINGVPRYDKFKLHH